MGIAKEGENVISGFRNTSRIRERAIWSGKMNSLKDNGCYSHNFYMNELGPASYLGALDLL